MSDLHNHSTIHIDVPEEADNDEAEWFIETVMDAVHEIEIKGEWDPFVSSHRHACEDSDHCVGSGSRYEAKLHDEIIEDILTHIRSIARGYQNKKLGNMTWAEVLVVINGMKRQKEKREPNTEAQEA